MSTVQFQINPSHIKHYKNNRHLGGVCVEATNLETKETGWLYVGHTRDWNLRKHLLANKVKWVVSCRLKETELSPFAGGNEKNNVKTLLSGTKLSVRRVGEAPHVPQVEESIYTSWGTTEEEFWSALIN